MSIKKSFLEQKWYYRVAKMFFLLLPLLIAAIVFYKGFIKGDTDYTAYFIFALAGLIPYYLILHGIWRGFLYIAFGGLDNDTKKKNPVVQVDQAVGTVAQPVQAQNQAGPVIGIIFFIIIIMIIATYSTDKSFPGSSIFSGGNTYGTSCTANGKKGLYGTNGSCMTCSSGTAATSPVNNCSDGIAGVYCCTSGGGTSGGGGSKSTCIPTGCGTQWNCSGYYYPASGTRTSVSGCFSRNQSNLPSWSGICRQCP